MDLAIDSKLQAEVTMLFVLPWAKAKSYGISPGIVTASRHDAPPRGKLTPRSNHNSRGERGCVAISARGLAPNFVPAFSRYDGEFAFFVFAKTGARKADVKIEIDLAVAVQIERDRAVGENVLIVRNVDNFRLGGKSQ